MRLRPISAVVPKAMLPLVDRAGRVLPMLHYVLAEAASAGIDRAAVIVSPNHEQMLGQYVTAAEKAGLGDLPGRVEFVVQDRPLGFGHAVSLARGIAGSEPFMLLLGDHVYLPDDGQPGCAAQVALAYGSVGGAAMIGMQPVGPDELPRVGVAGGEPVADDIYRCTSFVEKPDLATARSRLATPGLRKNRFLAHSGIYVFTPEIFDCLEELITSGRATGGEVQLADAQSELLKRHERDYYLVRIRGRAYDVGAPAGYAATLAAFAGRPPRQRTHRG